MEEKERYELNDNDCIIDTEKDVAICDVYDVSESPETFVDLLNQQDKRIKELEQDKTKFMDLLNSMTENWWVSYEKNKKLRQENEQLKQQLDEKEQENERLKEEICRYEITLMDKNSQLKKQNQDKILFAVEQLEKVKKFLLEEHRDEEMDTDYIITKDAGEIADYLLDQIKQLKEMK